MIKHKSILYIITALSTLIFTSSVWSQTNATKPKLILQITVDQLRGDMPSSVYSRLGENGF
ncbi:MAG: hypothetical protein OEM04_07765, partial [Flavobacteriaceae bacterium]|nr:hypothetical protein [Flavobacteriaceae bacterium]